MSASLSKRYWPGSRSSGSVRRADPVAVQGRDVVADGREHAPDLMVAALREGQRRRWWREHLHPRRQERLVLAFQHQRAGGEELRLVAAQGPGEGDAVALGDVAAGRDDPVQQGAVVGQQQQARRSLSSRPMVEIAGSRRRQRSGSRP